MRKALLVVLVMALLLAGCGKPDLSQAPTIRLGRDVCAECGMTIDDTRFASAYYGPEGDPRLFDDLGDMLIYMRKYGEKPELVWVHDYESKQLLKMTEATFVAGPDIRGPHHGIVAFQSASAGRAFAADMKAHVLTWAELLEFDLAAAMHHNSH